MNPLKQIKEFIMLATEENIIDVISAMPITCYHFNSILIPKGITLRKMIDNCLACGIMNDKKAIENNIKNFIRGKIMNLESLYNNKNMIKFECEYPAFSANRLITQAHFTINQAYLLAESNEFCAKYAKEFYKDARMYSKINKQAKAYIKCFNDVGLKLDKPYQIDDNTFYMVMYMSLYGTKAEQTPKLMPIKQFV